MCSCVCYYGLAHTDGLAYRQTVCPTDIRRVLRTSEISCSSVVEPDMMPCGVLVFATMVLPAIRWSCLQINILAYRQQAGFRDM